jgi:Cu(I)/Ag(I) efflux system membrane fusion protein
MKRSVLFCLLALAGLVIASCAKKGEYQLRSLKPSEIGLQAICPVTGNVFTVDRETKAVDYKGKTYFLCCPDCSVDFQKKLGIIALPPTGNDKNIAYWTCPMHPQVKQGGPGQCPVCGMDLVPVYNKEGGRISVDAAKGKLLGLKSEAARIMHVTKTIRMPARVAYDQELYLAQQEYLLGYKEYMQKHGSAPDEKALNSQELGSADETLSSVRFRLKLLGLTDADIKELEKQGAPDKSLLFASDKVWLFADVFEGDLQTVKPGSAVTLVSEAYPAHKFVGKVVYLEPALNPDTRSAKARVLVENTGGLLKLDMYATATLKVSLENVLAIPKTGVLDTGVRKVAYIDYGNGEYGPRDIKTGFTGDEYVEVKDGLKAGELVVTNGNFMLDSESQLKK